MLQTINQLATARAKRPGENLSDDSYCAGISQQIAHFIAQMYYHLAKHVEMCRSLPCNKNKKTEGTSAHKRITKTHTAKTKGRPMQRTPNAPTRTPCKSKFLMKSNSSANWRHDGNQDHQSAEVQTRRSNGTESASIAVRFKHNN